jgi:hypothetical protein
MSIFWTCFLKIWGFAVSIIPHSFIFKGLQGLKSHNSNKIRRVKPLQNEMKSRGKSCALYDVNNNSKTAIAECFLRNLEIIG